MLPPDYDRLAALLEPQPAPLRAALDATDLPSGAVIRTFGDGQEEAADVLLCPASSVHAQADPGALAALCATLAAAVRPGGWVLLAAGPAPGAVSSGEALMDTHDGDGLKLVRSAVARVFGRMLRRDDFWLVARDNQPVETFEVRRDRALYSDEEVASAVASAGLQVVAVEPGRVWRCQRIG